MIHPVRQKLIACLVFISMAGLSMAQDPSYSTATDTTRIEKKIEKPFRISTSGKQVTIQSDQNIKKIIAWAEGGNRFFENNNIDETVFRFTVPPTPKIIFVLVMFKDGKHYTEKIALQ
jgi:hypothetical protein